MSLSVPFALYIAFAKTKSQNGPHTFRNHISTPQSSHSSELYHPTLGLGLQWSGSTQGWRQTCHFTKTQVKSSLHSRQRSSLRPTRDPSTWSVHGKRRVTRARRSPTPEALQVATSTAMPAVPACGGHATRALCAPSAPPVATCGSGASSKMSSSAQRPPSVEARQWRLLRHTIRTHKVRRHGMHGKSWDGRREMLAAAR